MINSKNLAIRSTSRIMRARLWTNNTNEPARYSAAASTQNTYKPSGINSQEDESLWDKVKSKAADAWEGVKGAADNAADKIMDTGSNVKADGAWEGSANKYEAGSKLEEGGLKLKNKVAEQDMKDKFETRNQYRESTLDSGISSSSTHAYKRGDSNSSTSGMWADGKNADDLSASSATFGQRAGLGGADMNDVKDYSASSSNKQYSNVLNKNTTDGVSASSSSSSSSSWSGLKGSQGGVTGMGTIDSDISSSSSSSKLPDSSTSSGKWASGSKSGEITGMGLSGSDVSSSTSTSSRANWPSTSKAGLSGSAAASTSSESSSLNKNPNWANKNSSGKLENNTDLSSSTSWSSNKNSREAGSVKDAVKDTARMFKKDGKRDSL